MFVKSSTADSMSLFVSADAESPELSGTFVSRSLMFCGVLTTLVRLSLVVVGFGLVVT